MGTLLPVIGSNYRVPLMASHCEGYVGIAAAEIPIPAMERLAIPAAGPRAGHKYLVGYLTAEIVVGDAIGRHFTRLAYPDQIENHTPPIHLADRIGINSVNVMVIIVRKTE